MEAVLNVVVAGHAHKTEGDESGLGAPTHRLHHSWTHTLETNWKNPSTEDRGLALCGLTAEPCQSNSLGGITRSGNSRDRLSGVFADWRTIKRSLQKSNSTVSLGVFPLDGTLSCSDGRLHLPNPTIL